MLLLNDDITTFRITLLLSAKGFSRIVVSLHNFIFNLLANLSMIYLRSESL